MIQSEGETQFLAARAQLLALRASLPGGVHVPLDRVRVGFGPEFLTDADAAAVLVGRPKPLRTTPTLEDGALCVSAEPCTPGWARVLSQFARAEALDSALSGSSAVILLKGRGESLVLTSAAYLAWRRDYQLPEHSGLGGGPPSDDERASGITFVWQVGRTEGFIESYSLTADSSVVCERCGARLAAVVFRDTEVDPPVKALLCSECLDVENGRKLVSVLNGVAVPPPFSDKMSDEQLRDFFRNFRIAPPEEVGDASPQGGAA